MKPDLLVWKRLAILSSIALVGGLILCSCGNDTFEVPQADPLVSGIIEGYLRNTDTPGNDPVAGARVFSTPMNISTSSDSSGYYQLTGLDPGFYQVTAITDEPRTASGNAYVASGQTTILNIDFAETAVPDTKELIYLSDQTLGRLVPYVSNSLGQTPAAFFVPDLGRDLGFVRWNPANPDEILYYTNDGGGHDIFLYDTQTRSPTPVTFTVTDEHGAEFSPDGTRIVFSGDTDADGNFEIIIVNRDGSGAVTLVDDYEPSSGYHYDNRWPSWSPDGYTIAFASRRTDAGAPVDQTDYELSTTPVNGGPIQTLTSNLVDDIHPAWHPSSTQIIWASYYNAHYQLFVMVSSPGAAQNRLTLNIQEDYWPGFDHSGQKVAWVSNANHDGSNGDGSTEIWVADFRGTHLENITAITSLTANMASVHFRPR